MSVNVNAIIEHIDNFLLQTNRNSIDPVEANALLAKAGLLNDSIDRPGKPLRELLRKGKFPHAFQSGGKGSNWTIPKSNIPKKTNSNYQTKIPEIKTPATLNKNGSASGNIDIPKIKKQIEEARIKYRPKNVKYLLIAEAPPDSIERFFYYENVKEKDYLFLGVIEALYQELKYEFIASGRAKVRKSILLHKMMVEGFYLLDLADLPLSFLDAPVDTFVNDLIEKVKDIATKNTKLILIMANVYECAFEKLRNEGFNVIKIKIPFPSSGQQLAFQSKFREALELAGYY